MANRITTTPVTVPIKFEGYAQDVINSIKQTQAALQSLLNTKGANSGAIAELQKQLKIMEEAAKEGNIKNASLNPYRTINENVALKELEKQGINLDKFNISLKEVYSQAGLTTDKISKGFDTLKSPIDKAETSLEKFEKTLVNSLRYNLVNTFVDAVMRGTSGIVTHLEQVDKKLNNIRIVSGKSAAEMRGFLKTANSQAREMNSYTSKYLEASEIFFQQGLSRNEVISRTEATIKASNIAAQDAVTTADQVTAILNGFNVEASQTINVLDKIAAVGAGTAVDFEEIAKAAQKVASSADTFNMSIDQTLGMIATISSVTREAPESIGTSLNAIFSRLNGLKVANSEYTSEVEKAFKTTASGLSVFEKQTGLLKDTPQILDEVAEAWDKLDKNQQRTIAKAMAGTRQMNRLAALLTNYDMYKEYTQMAKDSEGALEDQNKIFEDSLEAAENRAKTAGDALYDSLFNVELLKDWNDFLAEALDTLTAIVNKSGGLISILNPLFGIAQGGIVKAIGPVITKKFLQSSNKVTGLDDGSIKNIKDLENIYAKITGENIKLLDVRQRETALTREQKVLYNQFIENLKEATKLQERLNDLEEERDNFTKVNAAEDKIGSYYFREAIKRYKVKSKNFGNDFQIDENYGNTEEVKNEITIAKEQAKKDFDRNKKIIDNYEKYNSEKTEKQKQKYNNAIENNKILEEEIKLYKELEQAINKVNDLKERYTKNSKNSNEVSREQSRKEIDNFIDEMVGGETKNTAFGNRFYELLQEEKQAGNLDIKTDKTIRNIAFGGTKFSRSTLPPEVQDQVRLIAAKVASEFQEALKQEFEKVKGKKDEKVVKILEESGPIKSMFKAAKGALTTEKVFGAVQIGSSIYQAFKTFSDPILEDSQKIEGAIGSIGSAMMAIPGPTRAIGLAISTLGPIILEVTGIGQSKTEKLRHQIDAAKKSIEALTGNLVQQRRDLASVEQLYNKLAKQYQKQAFTYEQLTEEEKGQYDQVAEYIEQYAPELIKYYDMEGNAIIDLSKSYTDLEKNQKSYLRNALEFNELYTYSTLQDEAGNNANLLLKNFETNRAGISKIKKEIVELQAKALRTGKDMSKEMSALEEQLAKYQEGLRNTAKDWKTLFTDPTTKGTLGFSTLDKNIQDSLNNLASYQSFVETEQGLDTEEFQAQIQIIISSLTTLTDEQQKNFSNMTENMRNEILELAVDLSLTGEELTEYFSTMTAEKFISGDFILQLAKKRQNLIDEIKEGRQSIEEEVLTGYIQKTDSSTQQASYEAQYDTIERKETNTELAERLGQDAGLANIFDQIPETQNLFEGFSNEITLAFDEWQSGVWDFANSSAEAYNQVAEEYKKLKKELDNPLFDKQSESYQYLQTRVSRLYAVLQGDNEEYYNSWLKENKQTISEIAKTYGIDAANYKTYNEYKIALDETQTKLKVLYEKLAAGEIDDVNEELFNLKKQNAIQELLALKEKDKAALLLAKSTNLTEEQFEDELKLAKLKIQREELDNIQKSLEAEVTENKMTSEKKLSYFKQMIEEMDRVGGTNYAARIQTKLSDDTINNHIGSVLTGIKKSIDKQIGDLEDKTKNNKVTPEEIEKALKAIQGVSDLQGEINKFKYTGLNVGDINLKDVLGDKSQTVTKPAGGVGSSKEIEDLKFDLNPLKRYEDTIEELTHQLEVLQKEREKLFGQDYLKNLTKEADINRDIIKTEQAKLEKIKEISAEYQKQLSDKGVKFDAFGLIENYNQILEAQEEAVNKLNGEAKETAKKSAEELKELMDKYEEYALDKKHEAEKSIQDLKSELADLARERIEYPIQIILDISKEDADYINFISNAQKYQKGKINFSIEATQSVKNLLNSLNTVQEIFKQTNGGQGFLDSVLKNPDLQGDTQKQLEMIREQEERMSNLAEELTKFAEEFENSFANALGEATKILSEELNKFNNITAQYEYLLDLASKLNKISFDSINDVYGKLSNIYKNNLTQSQTVAATLKESRDAFDVGTKEWLLANEKYMDAQATVMEQEKKLAELMAKQYDTTVSTGRKNLESVLFGGSTLEDVKDQFKAMTDERNRFLDTERKVYELSKLERDINQDINKYQFDSKAQATLKKFMNDELKYLNSKKKLSQDDLDLTSKQYAVLKARIELERARDNEQYQLMLQRNEDGTFGYMYVQNMEMIEKSEQAYQDAVDELYKYSIKQTEKLQQDSISIRENALKEYDKIAKQLKEGTITEEEAVEKLNNAFSHMKDLLEDNAKAQAELKRSTVTAELLQILRVSEADLGGLNSVSDSLKTVFDIMSNTGKEANLSELFKALGIDSSEYVGSTGDKLKSLFKDLGGDNGAMEKLMEAFAQTGNSTAATIIGLLQQTGDLSVLTEKILEDSLNGAGTEFDELIDKISSGNFSTEDLFTDTLENGLEFVELTWEKLNDKILLDLDNLNKEFDMNNPESVLGQVTNNITQAYQQYHDFLEKSYEDLLDREEELSQMTGEYNKNLQTTVDKIREEIAAVTEVTKKYAGLRDEVLKSIEEILKYVNLLEDAKDKIEQGSKSDTTQTLNRSNADSNQTNRKAVTLQAFHNGGVIDVNKEGLALVKEGESVLTENATNIMRKMNEIFDFPNIQNFYPYTFGSETGVSPVQNVQIHASFPNATNSKEIEDAFHTLYINAAQYLNHKN